jgi:hypothetical protein
VGIGNFTASQPLVTLDVKTATDPATTPVGILAPRVTLAQLNAAAKNGVYPISKHELLGTIVYVTDTVGGSTHPQTVLINANGYYVLEHRVFLLEWIPIGGQVGNGLNRTSLVGGIGYSISLGGSLIAPTTITATGANTLSIAGLQTGLATDSVVTVNAAGTLRKMPMPAGGGTQNLSVANDSLHISGGTGVSLDSINKNDWHIGGNANIIDSLHFLGTTNAAPLIFKVNNVRAGYLSSSPNPSASFGYEALLNNNYNNTNATGINNNAFGRAALKNNTDGRQNVAIGSFAMEDNTTGFSNTAIGHLALRRGTTARNNTAVGNQALRDNTGSAQNTAIGDGALLRYLGTDSLGRNTAVGVSAGLLLVSGVENTGVGAWALQGNSAGTYTGSFNTAVGSRALIALQTGASGNIAIGERVGSNITTGSNNILIGSTNNDSLITNPVPGSARVTTSTPTSNNQLNIGNVIYGINMYNSDGAGNDSTANGKIGIGGRPAANSPATLEVNGSATNTGFANGTTAVDFTVSNLGQASGTSVAIGGMKSGGTYTLACTAGGTAIPTLTLTAGQNGTVTTIRQVVGGVTAKTAAQRVVFTIVCINTTAYVYRALF